MLLNPEKTPSPPYADRAQVLHLQEETILAGLLFPCRNSLSKERRRKLSSSLYIPIIMAKPGIMVS
jgi:hypothetical protein